MPGIVRRKRPCTVSTGSNPRGSYFSRKKKPNVFVLGSELYHDYYRWPLKDRKVFESWREETHWGRLFAAYQRGDAQSIMHSGAQQEVSDGASPNP